MFDSRLFLVTERTQLLNACDKSPKTISIPWGSTVWGLRRTAKLEESSLRVTTVDLYNKDDQQEVEFLVDEILGDSVEEEVALRNGKRFVSRLMRAKLRPEKSTTTATKNCKEGKSLCLSTIPSSRTLCLPEQSFSKVSHSELAIDVHYRWTPSESLIDVSKPNRCVFVSGRVTDLPEKNDHTLKIGDEVCGVIPSGRVSRSLPIHISNVFKKPASLTLEQATFIPACLAIASHAIQRAASGAENQTIQIHQANRDPGPAAVALAKTLGHRVSCTISDTCKTSTKTLLLNLGAERVVRQSFSMLSEDPNDQIDAAVFFYPPFPNALNKNGRSLKKGGKVIIMSADFDGDVAFPANKNVKYERDDISDILRSPLAFEKLSLQSVEILESKGVLERLLEMQLESADLTTSMRAANGSFDNQSSRKQEVKESTDISFKIQSLATFEDENGLHGIPVLPRGLDECGLKENRAYLVAGGMGGFGFEVACWMAENGAKVHSTSRPLQAVRSQRSRAAADREEDRC